MLRALTSGLLSLIVVSTIATSAAAAGIQEWRTPNGRLFFGDHPPPGSTSIGKIEGTVPQIAVRDVDTSAEKPRSEEYTWRDGVGCQDLTFTDVSEGRFDGINRRIVRGSVKNDGRHLVRDVKVCGNGTCALLRDGDQMDRGESEAFHLDIQSGDPISLRIECSVREPV